MLQISLFCSYNNHLHLSLCPSENLFSPEDFWQQQIDGNPLHTQRSQWNFLEIFLQRKYSSNSKIQKYSFIEIQANVCKALSTRRQFLDKVIFYFAIWRFCHKFSAIFFVSCVAWIFSLCNFSLAILPSDELYVKTHVPDKSLVKILYKSFENNLAVF